MNPRKFMLLAALLLLCAAGCAQAPSPGPSAATQTATAEPLTAPAPADSQIAPMTLSDEEKQLLKLVSANSLSLFRFKTDPSLRQVDFWIEPYHKGERQPTIGLGGMTCMENEPAQGEIMLKILDDAEAYGVELAVQNVGLARLTSETTPIDALNGHASQQLTKPAVIAENQEIVLRVDVFNEDRLYSPASEDGYLDPAFMDDGLMKEMNRVFVIKCRFSRPSLP